MVLGEDVAPDASGPDPGDLDRAVPGDPVQLNFTSGSTGEPKGVIVTHGNILRLVQDCAFADFGPGTVTLHAASPAFDATTLEVWGPLVNGGAIAPLAERPDPDAVAQAVARHGVTTLWLTAGLFHALVDRRPDALETVDHVLAGGDVVSPAHVERALAALPPGGRFTNGYGPTEGTTFTTTWTLRHGDPRHRPAADRPAGPRHGLPRDGRARARAARRRRGRAVDRRRRRRRRLLAGPGAHRAAVRRRPERALLPHRRPRPPAPVRRGAGVPRPRGRPGEDPRRARGAGRDRGRAARAPGGRRRGRGRDRQGHRQRQRALSPPPPAPPPPTGSSAADRRLAAYVVARPGGPAPSPAALRAHVAERLPAAMVPVAWVRMPSLPLTANGKVARERLPAPTQAHYARAANGDGHRAGPHERAVIEAFEAVLEIRPVTAEDDFFALGGHSLLALALCAEVQRRTGVRRRARHDLRRPDAARARRDARAAGSGAKAAGTRWSSCAGGLAAAAVRGHRGRRQPARVRRADPPAQRRAAGLRAPAAGARRPDLLRPQRAGARRALPRRGPAAAAARALPDRRPLQRRDGRGRGGVAAARAGRGDRAARGARLRAAAGRARRDRPRRAPRPHRRHGHRRGVARRRRGTRGRPARCARGCARRSRPA